MIECSLCEGDGLRYDAETNTTFPCVCREQRIAERRAKTLSKRIPRKYQNASLESTLVHDLRAKYPSIVRAIEGYVRDIDSNVRSGRGLWIYGDVGTGKTELAMIVSKTAMNKGFSVARYTLPQLLATIRGTYDDDRASTYLELLDQLTQVDVLHLDDVGAEQTSPWVLEQLYTIVNSRYEDERTIILTTNLQESDGMGAQIGERTASRLAEMCEVLPLNGPDYRVQTA